MSKSLGTFMMMGAVVIIIATLILGTAYNSLASKNAQHENVLQTEHQLKLK